MKRLGKLMVAFAVLCLFGTSTLVAEGPRDSVVQSFLKHLQGLDAISAEDKNKARLAVEDLQSDAPADAITEGLMVAYPDYAKAIEASDAADVSTAVAKLRPFASSEDKFLAADATFFLARALMNDERFEEALPQLSSLSKELADFTAHSASTQYFEAVAMAGLLKNKEAIESFMNFLQLNPDAPERLRVSAWRQIQQLQAIEEGKMEDIYQRMDFSRRRLELTEADEVTQDQQEKIINLLSKMIKEQEKKECSSCNSKSKNTKQQQQQQQQQAQNQPKPSKSQQGGTSSNPNGKFAEKSYDDSPASPWSRLRDRSRDPANNAIKEKLPARYRDIVEKYFETANGDGSKK